MPRVRTTKPRGHTQERAVFMVRVIFDGIRVRDKGTKSFAAIKMPISTAALRGNI
jgi:hypothetical protein